MESQSKHSKDTTKLLAIIETSDKVPGGGRGDRFHEVLRLGIAGALNFALRDRIGIQIGIGGIDRIATIANPLSKRNQAATWGGGEPVTTPEETSFRTD